MRNGRLRAACGIALVLAAAGTAAGAETSDDLREQVRQAETAFASDQRRPRPRGVRPLPGRRHDLAGPHRVARQAGRRLVEVVLRGQAGAFSWEPERVEVNDSGTLGISTGPSATPAESGSGPTTRSAPGAGRLEDHLRQRLPPQTARRRRYSAPSLVTAPKLLRRCRARP